MNSLRYRNKGTLVSQSTKLEKTVVMTCVVFMPPARYEILPSYIKAKGMTKVSCFALKGVPSDLFRVGSHPQRVSTKLNQLTMTTEPSLSSFLKRWVADFEETPRRFRKQRTEEHVCKFIAFCH